MYRLNSVTNASANFSGKIATSRDTDVTTSRYRDFSLNIMENLVGMWLVVTLHSAHHSVSTLWCHANLRGEIFAAKFSRLESTQNTHRIHKETSPKGPSLYKTTTTIRSNVSEHATSALRSSLGRWHDVRPLRRWRGQDHLDKRRWRTGSWYARHRRHACWRHGDSKGGQPYKPNNYADIYGETVARANIDIALRRTPCSSPGDNVTAERPSRSDAAYSGHSQLTALLLYSKRSCSWVRGAAAILEIYCLGSKGRFVRSSSFSGLIRQIWEGESHALNPPAASPPQKIVKSWFDAVK